MKFSTGDISAMIDAMGDDIVIGSVNTVGIFQSAGKMVELYNGSVGTTGPLLTLSEASAALVTENSTVITISGVQYQATQKLPDGAGFVELELTKDF